MNLVTSKILTSYIFKQTDNKEFEKWLYSSENIEDELGTELYLELISINYKDSNVLSQVTSLVDKMVNLGSFHKLEITELINEIENKQIEPLKSIFKLYEWAERGYTFLGRVDLIGNFGEQGKSVVHFLDDSMNIETQWNKINKMDVNFMNDLLNIKKKLETNTIRLTGESETFQFIGRHYTFEE